MLSARLLRASPSRAAWSISRNGPSSPGSRHADGSRKEHSPADGEVNSPLPSEKFPLLNRPSLAKPPTRGSRSPDHRVLKWPLPIANFRPVLGFLSHRAAKECRYRPFYRWLLYSAHTFECCPHLNVTLPSWRLRCRLEAGATAQIMVEPNFAGFVCSLLK